MSDENRPNQQPSLGAELKAMVREGVKDIREALVDQGYFGRSGGMGEPGTPLNPTPQMVTQDLGTVYGNYGEGPSPGYLEKLQEASRGAEHGQERDQGIDR